MVYHNRHELHGLQSKPVQPILRYMFVQKLSLYIIDYIYSFGMFWTDLLLYMSYVVVIPSSDWLLQICI
jgi:hypothetical protein